MVHPPPRCRALGQQCRSLTVTLRVGALSEGFASLDQEATWLLGHTQNISFSALRQTNTDLLVDAVLHVSCRYLEDASGQARCRAHGFAGPAPVRTPAEFQPRRLGDDRFRIVEQGHLVAQHLPSPSRSLPVLPVTNPCAAAPCKTADHVRGAACCRDLQIEILCDQADSQAEALVRSRRSPYLCKISREGDQSLGAEMISSCGYLEEGAGGCTLHGRQRPTGGPAKPDLCSEWPENGRGLHPGCVFLPSRPEPGM